MKRFIKRVSIVLLFSIVLAAICLLLEYLFNDNYKFNLNIFIISISGLLYLRFLDDVFDYDEDLKNNKELLKKYIYILLMIMCFIICLIYVIIYKNSLLLIYLVATFIFMQPFVLKKILRFFRVLLLPILVNAIFMVLHQFNFFPFQIIVSVICLIAGIIFMLRRLKQ